MKKNIKLRNKVQKKLFDYHSSEVLFLIKNTYKKHIESITITYLNTILVNIEVIEMDCLFVFLESLFNTVDEDE